MQVLSESGATFPSQIIGPSNVVDGVTAESVNGAFSDLGSRTLNLQAQIGAGINRLRCVATTAAMKALTGVVNGDVCLVSAVGFFYYSSTATLPGGDYALAYASTGMGAGAWLSANSAACGAAYGLATLDANSRNAQRPGATYPIVDAAVDLSTLGPITVATDMSPALLSSCPVQAGDVIFVAFSGVISAGSGYVDLMVSTNGGAYASVGGRSIASYACPVGYMHYVVAYGTTSVSLKLVGNPYGTVTYSICKANVRVMRP